ncbi:MAG: hypothetical protein DCC65_01230 [Planctomycetota bacterium]|nr:MAG: hypothetical protein DCC65_01230 [Planctomycetota bacterium]
MAGQTVIWSALLAGLGPAAPRPALAQFIAAGFGRAEATAPEDADSATADKDAPEEDREKTPPKGETNTAASKPAATSKEAEASNTPQVEVYIPSVVGLVDGFESSRAGRLCDAFAAMLPKLERESDEEFDVGAILALLAKIGSWPDTSVSLCTYTQDQEGRARWALRLDWPVDDLRDRVRELIEDERAKSLFADLKLSEDDDGSCRLELPDVVLAVFRKDGAGSLVASSRDVEPPKTVFGQKPGGASEKKSGSLLYCRLNLDAGDENEKAQGLFGQISMISSIRYAGSVDKDGLWRERFNVRWNPLLGLGIKTLLKKTTGTYECPVDAYAVGAVHLAMGEGLADSIAGLEQGTIGPRADGEMAFAVMPGTGFLPIPDLYYQFNARRVDRIRKDIRKAMRKDTGRRRDDDLPPAWHENEVDGETIFWRDPSADGAGGLSIANFRTVLFFDEAEDEGGKHRLIIAETSTGADDAVRRWKELKRQPRSAWKRLPDTSKSHWQIVLNWRRLYAFAQPYLSLLAASAEGGQSAPRGEELEDALLDSLINVRIEYAGLDVRHVGPAPLGFIYVPTVAAASLSAGSDPSSEAERERMACRNLRVLHHHAGLFKKDYGRWPATVAELDGYVDFGSHPNLLNLRPRDDGLLAGFVSVFTGDKRKVALEALDSGEIDDTLYEIDWAEDSWRLKYRAETFVNYATIYIDQDGKIHRVPRSEGKPPKDKAPEKKKKELARR